MSWSPSKEPTCTASESAAIDTIIHARTHDIGGFTVGRVLPALGRRMVGPFIFFDHMGPGDFAPGEGIDVRPHPHIGLATVTYLFEGEIHHRDSLGTHQPIRPGAINWMTAGRGIVHSERSGPEFRERGGRVHGIQLWIALPKDKEETKPSFRHHRAESIPEKSAHGVTLRVLAGEGFGMRSPVVPLSPLLYAEAKMTKGAKLTLPEAPELPERAVYVVSGALRCGRTRDQVRAKEMAVLGEEGDLDLRAVEDTHLMILAGAPLGHRHIFWNLVSSSKDRIERAKEDWREGRFPTVPGDEDERIPLPE